MAQVKTVDASVTKAFGRPVSEYVPNVVSLPFSFTYQELGENDEIPADEVLTPADILAAVNNKRYAAARAKAQAELFAAHKITKPGVLDTEEGQLNNFVKTLLAAGQTPENALAMARQFMELAKSK